MILLSHGVTNKSLRKIERTNNMNNKTNEENKTTKPAKVKEKISLYKYHKSKFLAWISIFVTEIFLSLTEFTKVDDKAWAVIITFILLILTAVFIIIWLANCLSKKIDKEDELAKANMTKAHAAISSFMLIMFAVVILITIIWKGSFTVTVDHDFVCKGFMIIYSLYLSLESGLFIHYDGKEIADCEDE